MAIVLVADRLDAAEHILHEPFPRRLLVAAAEEEAERISREFTLADRQKVRKEAVETFLRNLWRPGDSCTTQDGTRWRLEER